MFDSFVNTFRSNLFIIPENQRGYSWEKNQLDDLISDILFSSSHGNFNVYIGTIVCNKESNPDGSTKITSCDGGKSLVHHILEDGQQRLTTLSLLCKVLYDQINEIKNSCTDPYLRSQMDSTLVDLKAILFETKNRGKDYISRIDFYRDDFRRMWRHLLFDEPKPSAISKPQERLLYSYYFFLDFANTTLKTGQNLVDFSNRILNEIHIQMVELSQAKINKYLTFDAINSRGLGLTELDKVKNYSLFISSIISLPTLTDKQIEQNWFKAISTLDNYEVSERGHENTYINDLFNVYFNIKEGKSNTHDAFRKKFENLINSSSPAPNDKAVFEGFVQLWGIYANSYGFIECQDKYLHKSQASKIALSWLTQIDRMDFRSTVRRLLTCCHIKFTKSDFDKITDFLEKFVFRIYGICDRRTDTLEKSLIELSHNVLLNGWTLEKVNKVLCAYLNEWGNLNDCVKKLNDGSDRYSWRKIYYFLYEYERWQYPSNAKITIAFEPDKKDSIEHILPQSNRKKSSSDKDGIYWEKQFPKKNDSEQCKHRLGNLVLTTQNSELGRKSYPEKYLLFTGNKSTLSESKLPNLKNWKEENIIEREDIFIQFTLDRWKVNCCIDNNTFVWNSVNNSKQTKTIKLSHCLDHTIID